MSLKDFWSLLKQTVQEWSEDKASRLAAALAYYTIFSIAPLLIIVIFIAGMWFGESNVQQQVLDQIAQLTGSQETANAIGGMISSAYQPSTGILATVFSLGVLLFGATGVFTQLHDAMNTIWEVAPEPGAGVLTVLRKRFLSFTMILGIGFLLLVSLVISAALANINTFFGGLFPGAELVFGIINFVISFGVITLLFAMIFKILPDVEIEWSDVWLGAAVTALLFTIGKTLIGWYMGRAAVSDTYGAAGSLVVILLWVYYSAQILFLGAEFTQVYANRFGTRLQPEEGAVALTEQERAEQGIPRESTVEKKAAGRPSPAQRPAAPNPVVKRGLADAPAPAAARLRRPERYMPQPEPSLLAVTSVVAILVGFISGMVVKRPKK